jgi:hypothetical protein
MPDRYDTLEAELRSLGAALQVSPPADDLAAGVLLRIAAEPVPGRPSAFGTTVGRARDWLRARWRSVVAALTALIVGLSLAPPVRAGVGELFGFSGVIVQRSPGPGPGTAPPPPAAHGLTLEQARGLIGFAPRVPAALGPPAGVEVSADRRVLSLSWPDGRGGFVRLDEFGGRTQPAFWKTVHDKVDYVRVGDRDGVWFRSAHEVVVLDAQGNEHHEPPRLAGPTLVWEHDGITLRLEGARTLPAALSIGASVR